MEKKFAATNWKRVILQSSPNCCNYLVHYSLRECLRRWGNAKRGLSPRPRNQMRRGRKRKRKQMAPLREHEMHFFFPPPFSAGEMLRSAKEGLQSGQHANGDMKSFSFISFPTWGIYFKAPAKNCRKEKVRICGPETCPLVQTEPECRTEVRKVSKRSKQESKLYAFRFCYRWSRRCLKNLALFSRGGNANRFLSMGFTLTLLENDIVFRGPFPFWSPSSTAWTCPRRCAPSTKSTQSRGGGPRSGTGAGRSSNEKFVARMNWWGLHWTQQ